MNRKATLFKVFEISTIIFSTQNFFQFAVFQVADTISLFDTKSPNFAFRESLLAHIIGYERWGEPLRVK